MTVESAVIIAVAIVAVAAVGTIIFVATRQQKAKEEEMRRAASARGWKFEIVRDRGYRIQRWTGASDGISWIAESATFTGGGQKHQRRRHAGRWHGAFSPGISSPLVAMGVPKGKEQIGTTLAEGEGFIARMAQKAAGFAFDKAIDVYFGPGPGADVDAGAMRRVDAMIPGYVIMAADTAEGSRIMQQGLERSLVAATSDTSSVLSEEDRPWVLLRPQAVSLARMERFRDINEIERFVQAGIALTRSFTFGRRSPS